MMKLYSAILTKAEADGDTETVQEVNQMLQEKLPAFAESADLEVQERVRSVQSITFTHTLFFKTYSEC